MTEEAASDDHLPDDEWATEMGRRYPRAFAKWNAAEEQRLLADFLAGKGIDELAAVHGRRPSGIASRLAVVGLLAVPDASPVRRAPSKRQRDGAPAVLCDGCGVALEDADVNVFERYLELCAACYCAAVRCRRSTAS